MSELNVYHHELRPNEYAEFYLKYEADKVIAEKDAEIVELKEQVHDYALGLFVIQAKAGKELRHSNYKRCMAMAKRCAVERDIYNLTPRFAKVDFYSKWHNRWLELAEKFKEAK